jgi:hypothetical protein
MTSRECLLSAMAGKMTDRVPVTLFICDQGHFLNQMAPEIPATNFAALQLKVVELQKQFGCDIFLRVLYGLVDPLNLIYGGLDVSQQTATWEVMTEEIRKCSMILQHSTIRTPKGWSCLFLPPLNRASQPTPLAERFAVRAWPTLVLVDAEGYVRETLSGEAEEGPLAARVEALLAEGSAKGALADGPLDVAPDPEADRTFLRFPGKVHVADGKLFVADSGHNRIVVSDLDGRALALVGEGGAGAHDGPPSQASFHDPQGMTVAQGRLFVADRGNHLIRSVALSDFAVTTIAGTGAKGEGHQRFDAAAPRTIPLRSPWALAWVDPYVVIAMAGSHQIWGYDTEGDRLGVLAGTGREDHVDGAFADAAFAQPSGLAHAGRLLFVADSEISSVRALDLEDGVVKTLVGRGLFDFGDRDGRAEMALLQHPLDVACEGAVVHVADSYNHKIKAIDLRAMQVRTLYGDGGTGTLDEPGGIAIVAGTIFIADTNHHRILRGDIGGGPLEVLPLERP